MELELVHAGYHQTKTVFQVLFFPLSSSLLGGGERNIWKIEIKMQSPRISLFNFFAYYLLIFVLIKITIYMFFWLQ